MKKQKFKQGIYIPKNKYKFKIIKNKQNKGKIFYRSSWEYKFLKWCDYNKNISLVISEGVKIPYKYKNKIRNYYPDFLIKLKDKFFLIEIKPKYQVLNEMNKQKFKSARYYCDKKNFIFKILTEKELKPLLNS